MTNMSLYHANIEFMLIYYAYMKDLLYLNGLKCICIAYVLRSNRTDRCVMILIQTSRLPI